MVFFAMNWNSFEPALAAIDKDTLRLIFFVIVMLAGGFIKMVLAVAKHHTNKRAAVRPPLSTTVVSDNQARSKRSAFITLVHALAKSFANFSLASALP